MKHNRRGRTDGPLLATGARVACHTTYYDTTCMGHFTRPAAHLLTFWGHCSALPHFSSSGRMHARGPTRSNVSSRRIASACRDERRWGEIGRYGTRLDEMGQLRWGSCRAAAMGRDGSELGGARAGCRGTGREAAGAPQGEPLSDLTTTPFRVVESATSVHQARRGERSRLQPCCRWQSDPRREWNHLLAPALTRVWWPHVVRRDNVVDWLTEHRSREKGAIRIGVALAELRECGLEHAPVASLAVCMEFYGNCGGAPVHGPLSLAAPRVPGRGVPCHSAMPAWRAVAICDERKR